MFLKLRSIVASPSCLIHRYGLLRRYSFVAVLKTGTKIHLRNTSDFLNNLPDRVQPKPLLALFDIEALYTKNPLELGMKAVRYCLAEDPEEIKTRALLFKASLA